jgi:hypothetical protein
MPKRFMTTKAACLIGYVIPISMRFNANLFRTHANSVSKATSKNFPLHVAAQIDTLQLKD